VLVVFDTAGFLDPGAATHVDLGRRQRGRAATGAGQFKNGDIGTGFGSLDGSTGTGGTKADDGDIGFNVPLGDGRQLAGFGRFSLFSLNAHGSSVLVVIAVMQ